ARPADAVLAADVRADEVEVLAQEVDEQRPRLDVALVADPVDGGRDPHDAPPRARASARSTQARATRRRYAAPPWTSSLGWSASVAAAATSALAPPSASRRSASLARTGVSATQDRPLAPAADRVTV